MAKYRLLTKEELEHLEKEFIAFLAAQTIPADDWVQIKADNPDKANQMIHTFSDVIMEEVLRKTQFLEKTDKNRIASIHFQSGQMILAAMEAPIDSDADFRDQEYIAQATVKPPGYLKAYTTAEKYESSRELELFKFIELGWLVSDGKLYKTLCLAVT